MPITDSLEVRRLAFGPRSRADAVKGIAPRLTDKEVVRTLDETLPQGFGGLDSGTRCWARFEERVPKEVHDAVAAYGRNIATYVAEAARLRQDDFVRKNIEFYRLVTSKPYNLKELRAVTEIVGGPAAAMAGNYLYGVAARVARLPREYALFAAGVYGFTKSTAFALTFAQARNPYVWRPSWGFPWDPTSLSWGDDPDDRLVIIDGYGLADDLESCGTPWMGSTTMWTTWTSP